MNIKLSTLLLLNKIVVGGSGGRKVILFALLPLFFSCQKKEVDVPLSDFPSHIETIFKSSCATSGCHNKQSRRAAAGLSLESWSDLMEGANNGNAAVVPYSAQQSPLFFFVNTHDDLGPTLEPTMPLGRTPLSREQIIEIRNWIDEGAKNARGVSPFQDRYNRDKLYVLNSLCNQICAVDPSSGLVTRYINLGDNFGEFPEVIAPWKDGVLALSPEGNLVSVDHSTGSPDWSLNLGNGWWRTLKAFPNGKLAIACDFSGNSFYEGGQISIIDLEKRYAGHTLRHSLDSIYFPYGLDIKKDNSIAYISCYKGNFVYALHFVDNDIHTMDKILLHPGEDLKMGTNRYKPGNLVLSADQNKLFVLCEASNEVRVIDLRLKMLSAIIKLESRPYQLELIDDRGILAVSCTEDETWMGRKKGAVVLIDIYSNQVIKKVYTGYQPRGLAYDHKNALLYVANRNADPVGADQPHHFTACNGNNGYLTSIDLNTLELKKNYKAELSVEPYTAVLWSKGR